MTPTLACKIEQSQRAQRASKYMYLGPEDPLISSVLQYQLISQLFQGVEESNQEWWSSWIRSTYKLLQTAAVAATQR